MWVDWLAPVLLVSSAVLLARAFYLLYGQKRGSRSSGIFTWLSALLVTGFWIWRLS